MILEFWQASLIAMISALCAIKILRPIAIDINLVDIPDDRKQHDGSVPLIGGLSIYFGLMVAIYITQPLPDNLFYLLMTASLVLLIGLLDDLKGSGYMAAYPSPNYFLCIIIIIYRYLYYVLWQPIRLKRN